MGEILLPVVLNSFLSLLSKWLFNSYAQGFKMVCCIVDAISVHIAILVALRHAVISNNNMYVDKLGGVRYPFPQACILKLKLQRKYPYYLG